MKFLGKAAFFFIGYSDILFIRNPVIGAILALITFFHPATGVSGVIGVMSAGIFGYLLHFNEHEQKSSCYIYNPLLVGMSIGYLFEFSAISLIIVIISGILSFMMTFIVGRMLEKQGLPVISLPFALASIMLYLAAIQYLAPAPAGEVKEEIFQRPGFGRIQREQQEEFSEQLQSRHSPPGPYSPHLTLFLDNKGIQDIADLQDITDMPRMDTAGANMPGILSRIRSITASYFQSLGNLFFTPYIWAGAVIALLILLHSPMLFFLSIAGFITGTLVHASLLSCLHGALRAPYSFNYILVAIALGGIFLVPSIRSLAVMLAAVAVTVIVTDVIVIFLAVYNIPAFVLPFNLVTIAALYMLKQTRFEDYAAVIKGRPEETLFWQRLNNRRFPGWNRSIYPPFTGRWKVYQSHHGEWTHQGDWSYAWDFVIADLEGNTYRNSGAELEDYYAFGKPVLSPVKGQVVRAVSHFRDNNISEVDTENNWGNHVVISTIAGFYVEISHFAWNSLKVQVGDMVEAGQILGLCGNSGYSPQPHIHVQVQNSPEPGAATQPFNFLVCRRRVEAQKDEILWHYMPEKDENIESFAADKLISSILSFSLDTTCTFNCSDGSRMTVTVCMDHFSGRFYMKDGQDNRLYFARDAGMFYFYDYQGDEKSPLLMFYIAAPRIPLALKPGTFWRDYMPASYIGQSRLRLFDTVRALYRSDAIFCSGEWEAQSDGLTIGGDYILSGDMKKSVSVALDHNGGFREIIVDNRRLYKA